MSSASYHALWRCQCPCFVQYPPFVTQREAEKEEVAEFRNQRHGCRYELLGLRNDLPLGTLPVWLHSHHRDRGTASPPAILFPILPASFLAGEGIKVSQPVLGCILPSRVSPPSPPLPPILPGSVCPFLPNEGRQR